MEQRILETCMREGLPIPERMRNAPSLKPGLELFLVAYTDLDRGRPVIYGDYSSLSWDLIDRWCHAHGIFGETREDVFAHVRSLDDAYLKWRESKRPKGKGK